MNLYLLHVIYKWLSILFMTILSIFHVVDYEENEFLTSNFNDEKDLSVISTITPYQVEYVYNNKMPNNLSKTIKKGILGVSYQDIEGNHIIQEVENAIIEQGTGSYGLFTGKLTGYGPDCVGCSTVGNVACKTKNKQKHSLINDGIYYTDDEYGSVRIIAAASSFPCGTIVQIRKEGSTPFYAIVLDRGGSMNYAWSQGRVWMDLAYESNAMASSDNLTGKNIEFSVQRWGW